MYLLSALEQQHCLISDPGVSPSGCAMTPFLNWLKVFGSAQVFPLAQASQKPMQLLMVHHRCFVLLLNWTTHINPSTPGFSKRWSTSHGKRYTSDLRTSNSTGLKKGLVSHSSRKFKFALPIFQKLFQVSSFVQYQRKKESHDSVISPFYVTCLQWMIKQEDYCLVSFE